MSDKELMALAIKARDRAYAPYSNFAVGAALLTEGGKVYLGCNIENASFSPTNCAERTAIFSAIADGENKFSAIAICGGKIGAKRSFCTPCGVCRQVLSEFCGADLRVILEKEGGELKLLTLGDLLPFAFDIN